MSNTETLNLLSEKAAETFFTGTVAPHHYAPVPEDRLYKAHETIDRLNQLQETDLAGARARQAGDEVWLNRVLITSSRPGVTGAYDGQAGLSTETPLN